MFGGRANWLIYKLYCMNKISGYRATPSRRQFMTTATKPAQIRETAVMRAAVLESHGAPLQLREIAKPKPGKGEVLVKIAASGVNPLDLKIAAGQADHAKHPLPAILGIDLAGT